MTVSAVSSLSLDVGLDVEKQHRFTGLVDGLFSPRGLRNCSGALLPESSLVDGNLVFTERKFSEFTIVIHIPAPEVVPCFDRLVGQLARSKELCFASFAHG